MYKETISPFLNLFPLGRYSEMAMSPKLHICRHLKKIDQLRDFAAGVYQSLSTGDTVSHVGIFDTAF
jgi:hypothetical protein